MDKKAVMGLHTVEAVIVALLVLAVLVVAAILAVTTIQTAYESGTQYQSGAVTNETITPSVAN